MKKTLIISPLVLSISSSGAMLLVDFSSGEVIYNLMNDPGFKVKLRGKLAIVFPSIFQLPESLIL